MPDSPAKPVLEDPAHEKEIFASEIAGIGVVHNNIVVTLATVRFEEAVGIEPPPAVSQDGLS